MNSSIRSMMVLMAMFAVGASAQERSCATSLSNADLVAAIGAGVAFQPVFAGGNVKGFRLYNLRHSAQLTAQGIDNGALMTHVCGVPASEIHARRGNACCSLDASRQFELTFQLADGERKLTIRRP
jgi:hypothetical protein